MNILCGVLNQTSGEVYIDGIDLRKHPTEAKSHIGFLPQTAPLYMDLTINEYLQFCAQLRNMETAVIPSAVEEVMDKCGIVHVKNRLLKNLSGGYRQRVGIAQSIVHKTALVIIDEPTNGLDPIQIIDVRNLIKEISDERTVILSSHILSEIQLLCQEIIMIEQGQIVFSDSMEAFNNYVAPQSILLEFENPPAMSVFEMIKGVNRVERLRPKTIRIFYNGSGEVNEMIITTSVEQKWRLTELVVESNSIDEIFKQLAKTSTSK
jgi:ABC-2 type transport system ATP-binding protein